VALDSESRWRLVRQKKAKAEAEVSAEPTIRSATAADLTAIVEIYNYYIKNSVVTFDVEEMPLQAWRDKFHHTQELNMPFIVAESSSGQVLGFAYVAPWRQKAAYKKTVENSIYLRPAATGKRIGTKLLADLLSRCKDAGIKEVVAVMSDKGAESSIALHEQFGFKRQGHLAKVGFKFGRWLGIVLMQKSL